MEDERKSRKQLLRELAQLRRKVAELATSEAECKQAEEALASYREGLEDFVEERTSRLIDATARLEQELAERKWAEVALRASHRLLTIAHTQTQMTPLLEGFLAEVKNITACDSVGIRLVDEEGMIPYEAYDGFSETFYQSESPLSIKSDQCMCINVIKGDTHPSLPFYTESGSFHMNGTTRFLATVSEEEKGETRNVCNEFGYESVALVPIRAKERILGLIHVADRREGMVPLPIVTVLEAAAMQLGTALERVRAEEALASYREGLEGLVEERTSRLMEATARLEQELAERKRGEEALRESEELYRTLVETSPDAMTLSDLDTTVRMCNQQAAALLGFDTVEEVIGKRSTDFFAPEDHERAWANARRTLQEGTVRDVEYTFLRRDGSRFPGELSASLILDADGKPKAFMALTRDITARKRGQEALAAERNLLRTVMDNVLDHIFLKDTESRFITTNAAHLRVLGAKRVEEVVGKTDADFFPREWAERYYASEQEIMRSGEPLINYEERAVDSEGRWHSLLTTKVPLRDDAGSVVGLVGVVRDITARKQAEEALAAERNLLRTLMDNMPDPAHVKDAERRYVLANPALAQLMGLESPEQIIGNTALDLYPEALARRYYYADDEQVLTSGEPLMNREEMVIDADGQERWFLTSKVPLRDAGGSVVGLVGMSRDITARKRGQEALAAERNLLRTLIDNLPDCVYAKDAESRFTLNNVANARLLGATTWDETIGKTDFDFHLHEMAQRYYADEQEILRTGQPLISREEPFIDPDGNTGWLLTTKVPLRDSTGEIVGLVGMGRDITERKRAEEALRRAKEFSESLIASMQDGFCILDSRRVLIDVNPALCQMTGFSREELIGVGAPHPYWPPEAYGEIERTFQEILQGEFRSFELTFMRKNGERFPVLVSPSWIKDDQGNVVAYFATVKDITEQKALIAELEAKNAELERFIYTVSHDLRSPLITVKAFSGLLERDALAGDAERMRSDLARISSATDRMRQLLDELLELSRIGHVVGPSEEVALGDLARQAVSTVAADWIVQRGVEVQIADDLPLVFGDRSRLLELLENLLDNAFKFMGDQPHPCVRIGHRRDGEQTVFFVQDNGVGIDPRYQERIFDLFYKLDQTGEGTGVGLSIAKRIVETHGGRIWVESEGHGQGSTFCFTVPDTRQSTSDEERENVR